MSITPFLKDAAFEPEVVALMGAALRDALRALKLTDRRDPATEFVAAKIIDLARLGERDPHRLCARALQSLTDGKP
ncbi:MAG: hypothetical protein WA418_08920 [Bradyrhizobium sp.]